MVEESDYLPFGTENVITSTINNNYKFIAMERDFEGTAALDHTLFRQYAPNLARWTTPDPLHGTPANPQSWNRYPYVLNDPLTLTDPLGGPTYDASFVGCYPDPFYEGDFGCGWLETGECPPGFVEVHGQGAGPGYPAIANMGSLHQYANDILWPAAEQGYLSYELGPNGVRVNLLDVDESIVLGSLNEVLQLSSDIALAISYYEDAIREPKQPRPGEPGTTGSFITCLFGQVGAGFFGDNRRAAVFILLNFILPKGSRWFYIPAAGYDIAVIYTAWKYCDQTVYHPKPTWDRPEAE